MLETNINHTDSEIMMVSSPDHPVLVTPPDLLAAKNGKLVAYYKLKASEKNSPKNLLSRLALSRFALPIHTQHVLVINESDENSAMPKLYSSFEKVIGLSELDQSFLLLNDSPSDISIERASIGREKHYVKYNLLFELSLEQLNSKGDERKLDIKSWEYEKALYSDWLHNNDLQARSNKSFESKHFYKLANGYFAAPDFEKSKRRLELLRNLCLSSMQIDSDYDDGSSRRVSHESKVILSRALPGYRHDEFKGLRGASFAGLGLSYANNDESLNKYSEYINDKFERGFREHSKKKNRYYKRNSRR